MQRKIYKDELTKIISNTENVFCNIKANFTHNDIINKGLFLMATAYFEATVRDIMKYILTEEPSNFDDKGTSISSDDILRFGDNRVIDIATDNYLFNLFKGNMKDELIKLYEFATNIRNFKNKPKNSKYSGISDLIDKISDISYYRNCLIHQSGLKSKDFDLNVVHYIEKSQELNYSEDKLRTFIEDYLNYLEEITTCINKNQQFHEYTRIGHLRDIWSFCFQSPIMSFNKFWEVDMNNDLITGIKYPDDKLSLSKSEGVLLSIWRHQFNDNIPMKSFLLCSIDYSKLQILYEELDKARLYHMYEESMTNDR